MRKLIAVFICAILALTLMSQSVFCTDTDFIHREAASRLEADIVSGRITPNNPHFKELLNPVKPDVAEVGSKREADIISGLVVPTEEELAESNIGVSSVPFDLDSASDDENAETEEYKELYAYITEYGKKLSDVHYDIVFNEAMPNLLRKNFDSHKLARVPGFYDGEETEDKKLLCPFCLSTTRSVKICIGDIVNKSSDPKLFPDRAQTYAYCKSCSSYYFLSGQFHDCGEDCEYRISDEEFEKIIDKIAKRIYDDKKKSLEMTIDLIADSY